MQELPKEQTRTLCKDTNTRNTIKFLSNKYKKAYKYKKYNKNMKPQPHLFSNWTAQALVDKRSECCSTSSSQPIQFVLLAVSQTCPRPEPLSFTNIVSGISSTAVEPRYKDKSMVNKIFQSYPFEAGAGAGAALRTNLNEIFMRKYSGFWLWLWKKAILLKHVSLVH